ncbi:methylated-DNA--[protein]-cysteine S-methyltransferase [Enterococcus dispar]|uniref:methylated-DNA--[protein]-cysteine S-methyltransferase n=1 Tax=Enterococcus dispar TaxID=44009 RepID=UPI00288CCFE8|nr:methylated-DNA--[protein]-cysteine S-methyltransferase [Enterococcus dispar]MDT2706333.1 methylated-DNA--[protein]-cysteine S-methyltransferase [Enterococcus dispar]
METILIDRFTIDVYHFVVGRISSGVCYIGLEKLAATELAKFFKGWPLKAADGSSEDVQTQLTAYFTGKLEEFNFPLALVGTDFQKKVWQKLEEIPYGKTISYSRLAQQVENEKRVRAVANAVGRNPVMIVIPCHRIIGKNGRLTGYRGGISMKVALLEQEGISEFAY